MKSKLMNLVWINMIGLLLAACKSDAHDVATLKTRPVWKLLKRVR